MRYATYNRMVLETGEVHQCQFEVSHFAEMGMRRMSQMPRLEGLELVNKWNRAQSTARRFFYWLD